MGFHDVLIVGAGHGGAQAAIALRQRRFAGRIAIVGAEPDHPYERPPLSKDYLAGDKPFERILIRPPAFWADRDVAILTGRRIVAIDPARRVATGDNGERFEWGRLIWAAGGEARRPTCRGRDLAGVHTIRTRADADALAADLAGAARAVVVGGGYIGLEAAAVLAKRGLAVTLVEAQPRVLARVAGEALSRFFEAEHRAHGVDLRLGIGVEAIEGDARVTGVRLAGGEIVAADLVVVGIGIAPVVAPLIAAGAVAAAGGVLVDAEGRTGVTGIYAVGDGAAQANPYAGGQVVRVESVGNAADQANAVARAITGEPAGEAPIPWFWSNQYDLKLQTIGWSAGHDEAVVRGDPADRSFSVVYRRGGRVVALDCVNAVRDYVQGRALVVAGARIAADRLADPGTPLKTLAGG